MKRINLFLAALALASPLTLVSPALPSVDARLEASDCGGFDGPLCKAVESCWKFGTYSRCETEYSYYQKPGLEEEAG